MVLRSPKSRAYLRTVRVLGIVCAVMAALSAVTLAQVTIEVYLRAWEPELSWELEMIQEFERRNPHIRVEPIIVTPGEYWTKKAALQATGLAPDVVNHAGVGPDAPGRYLDLTEFVERDRDELNLDEIYPAALAASQVQGRWYGLPMASMGTFMFYNKTMFDEYGLTRPSADWEDTAWTWNVFTDYARRLTLLNENGLAERLGVDFSVAEDQLMIWYAWNWAGDWFDAASYEKGRVQGSRLLDPLTVDGYRNVIDMIVNSRVAAGVQQWQSPPINFPFIEEKTGMWWVGGFTASTLKALQVPFEWGLAPLPLTPSGRTTMVLTDHWKVLNTTKHPEEAWEFVKFITSEYAMRRYAEVMGFAPARHSAIESFVDSMVEHSGMTPVEVIQALTGSQAHGRPGVALLGTGDAVRVITPYLMAAFRGEMPIENALGEADRALQALIREGQW